MNVYVALTTIPSRFGSLHKCVSSLLNQSVVPDKIFISIPKRYKRFNYSKRDLAEVHKKLPSEKVIKVIRTEKDFGPGTKLLGCLSHIAKLQKNSKELFMVILVDDDHIYRSHLVESMVKRMGKRKNRAYSFCVYHLNTNLIIGQGADGFAIHGDHLTNVRKFFEIICEQEPLFFYHDDFWISLFLFLKGVKVKEIKPRDKGPLYYRLPSSNKAPLNTLKGKKSRLALNVRLLDYAFENQENLFQKLKGF